MSSERVKISLHARAFQPLAHVLYCLGCTAGAARPPQLPVRTRHRVQPLLPDHRGEGDRGLTGLQTDIL